MEAKQERIISSVSISQERVLLFLLFFVLIFCNQFKFNVNQNEGDLLACALQYVNPNWLPNDWYLNLKIPYRVPFNFLIGNAILSLGLWTTIVLGRCITYALFASFFLKICRQFNLHYITLFIFLLYFLPNQSLAAGEWMVRDLETKVFAYASILFASYFLWNRKYAWSLALAGVALSTHLLVGAYGGLCLLVAFVVFRERFSSDFLKIAKTIPLALLTGGWGLYAVVSHLFKKEANSELAHKGWEYYVTFRVPHHTIPEWVVGEWVMFTLFTLILIWVIVKSNQKVLRFFAVYTLTAVGISVVGLLVYTFLPIVNMKYYWFRLADVLLPFFGGLLLLAMLKEKWGATFNSWVNRKTFTKGFLAYPKFLNVGLIALFFFIFGMSNKKKINAIFESSNYTSNLIEEKSFDKEMVVWIKANTSQDAIFVVPSFSNFYLESERAVVGVFKFSPQNGEDIANWYERMVDMNNGNPYQNVGFDAGKEQYSNYSKMDSDFLQYLKTKYQASYYLSFNGGPELNDELVFSSGNYKLYKIN